MPGPGDLLAGKVGLVIGVANDQSIAAGCAQAFRKAGADLVLTCTEKSMRFVTGSIAYVDAGYHVMS